VRGRLFVPEADSLSSSHSVLPRACAETAGPGDLGGLCPIQALAG
jgi:hypothetical protein